MTEYITATLAKAEAGGARPAELAALARRLEQLTHPQAGRLPGDSLEPLGNLDALDDLSEPTPAQARFVLDRLVVVKLNGGLGTSMGLSGPKSLLPVKNGRSFLDILATQVLALREHHQARLPLLLMNSAMTRSPTLELLGRYPTLKDPSLPLDFLQGREPKLRPTTSSRCRGLPTRVWNGVPRGTATSTRRFPHPECCRRFWMPACGGASFPTSTTWERW